MLFNFVARYLQSKTAKNIKLVKESAGEDPWTAGPRKLKEGLQKNEVVATSSQSPECLEDWLHQLHAQAATGGQVQCSG